MKIEQQSAILGDEFAATNPPVAGLGSGRTLPWNLIGVLSLLIVTDLLLALIKQPPAYWLAPSSTTSNLVLLEAAIAHGPYFFAAAGLLYLLIAALGLSLLPRWLAITLYLPLLFIHQRNITGSLRCGIPGILETNALAVCGAVGYLLSVGLAVALAIIVVRSLLPSAMATSMSPVLLWGRRFLMVAVLTWLLILAYATVQAATIARTGWMPVVTGERPSARMDSAVAYDLGLSRAVLFGGAVELPDSTSWVAGSDTWLWDGSAWSEAQVNQRPPGRYGHSMAYDEQRQVVVLFGGRTTFGGLADTWEWNGEQWLPRYPYSSPPARWNHRLIYDTKRQRILLYGGYFKEGDNEWFYDDAWEWEGDSWWKVDFDTATLDISSFSLAYDQARGRAVAYRSCLPTGTVFVEDRHWFRPSLAIEPPARASHDMVYDPNHFEIVLFGGYCTRNNSRRLNDTWVWGNDNWRELKSPRSPSARWGHLMFFDQTRGRVMLFGGHDGHTYLDDMWELNLTDSADERTSQQ
jgi:hypothetical protein